MRAIKGIMGITKSRYENKSKVASSKKGEIMKKPVKVLLIVLVTAIGLTVVIGLGFNVFSRQFGDFYVSRQDYSEAIKWYEREYDFYHSEDSLVNIVEALRWVDNQQELKIKYLALLLEKKPSQITKSEYGNYYLDYLFALYETDRISEFKEEFESGYKLLKEQSDYLGILSPFTLIQEDLEASSEILIWSNSMIEKIILEYNFNDVKRFGYKIESLFYGRLGDLEKATEFDDKSNQYK